MSVSGMGRHTDRLVYDNKIIFFIQDFRLKRAVCGFLRLVFREDQCKFIPHLHMPADIYFFPVQKDFTAEFQTGNLFP